MSQEGVNNLGGGRSGGVLIIILECVPREVTQEEADLFTSNLYNDAVNKNKDGKRRNCLLKRVTEGNTDGTTGRGRRRKQLLGKEIPFFR